MRRAAVLTALLSGALATSSGCRTALGDGPKSEATTTVPLAPVSTSTATRATVPWEDFTTEGLARARREQRLILVSVYTRWCHWCHVMDEETWADPRVASILRDRFVTFRVDADERPDVAARYREWGWPATAVLTTDARPVLRIKGYRPPDTLLATLQKIVGDLDAGREIAVRDIPVESAPVDEDLAAVRSRLRAQLDGLYDEKQGGWGGPQKYPLLAPLEHSLRRARLETDPSSLQRARFTLEQQRGVLDSVWGGMFQYSTYGAWQRPHYEKLARLQGWALEEYAEAYRATGHEPFLDVAKDVWRFLAEHFTSGDGAFYANQDADVGHRGEPGYLRGHDFYALDDDGRRKMPAPFIDESVYAEHNGAVIAGLARLYRASLDDEVLSAAVRAAERLERTHANGDGTYRHAAEGDGLVHLADQAAMARALVALHQVTGEQRWLLRAKKLLEATLVHLEDDGMGALWAHTSLPGAAGVFAERQKPLRDNAEVARALLVVAELTGSAELRGAAERIVRFFARPEFLERQGRAVGDYLLAVEELTSERLHLAVVSSGEDRGDDLWREALRVFAPGVVNERRRGGERFPDLGEPALYVCSATFCSPPIVDAAEVVARVERLLPHAESNSEAPMTSSSSGRSR